MTEGALFQPGDLIAGRYRLLRLIGSGAMGMVWSARNESTDRDFALKLMLPSSASNPMRLQRFFQEAKACGRLRHRCIVEVYDLGRIESIVGRPPDPHAGTPYIVMELLEGEPLDEFCRRLGPLPVGTAMRVIADVATALEVAHRAGVVHRDLKPANLFLHKSPDGVTTPKILDFGISKLTFGQYDGAITSVGTVLGSPAYMSPEQTLGESDVDARSDVWSLGVILYRALSGQLPFRGQGYRALLEQISAAEPTPVADLVPGISAEIAAIVDKCLKSDKNQRFQSAQALADACVAALARNSLPRLDLSGEVAGPVELDAEDLQTSLSIRKLSPALGMASDPQETSPTRSIVAHASVTRLAEANAITMTDNVKTSEPASTTIAELSVSLVVPPLTGESASSAPSADQTLRIRSVHPRPRKRWAIGLGVASIVVAALAFAVTREGPATETPSQVTADERGARDRPAAPSAAPSEAHDSVDRRRAAPSVVASITPLAPVAPVAPAAPVASVVRTLPAPPPHVAPSAPVAASAPPHPKSTAKTASSAAHEGVTNAGF